MTTARIGWGAQFHLDNASNVLTELGEITAISLPNPQVADVEATHFKSPNRRREYIAGLTEDGEGSFEMNYDPNSATDVIIRAAIADGVTRSYKIVVPDSSANWEVTGDCIVKGYERRVPIDDRMTATLTVRFTGASTEAAAA
jgi:predicted secreted protein